MRNNSVTKLILGISALFLWGGLLVGVQSSSESNSWGDVVNGVQMRLSVPKGPPPPKPGDLPQFEIQIRNTGKDAVTIVLGDLKESQIVIDDLRYGPANSSNLSEPQAVVPQEIAPGAESVAIPVSFRSALYELNDIGAPVLKCGLQLHSGKHTVRVKVFGSITRQSTILVGISYGSLTSNPVTLDVPGTPAAIQHPCAPAA